MLPVHSIPAAPAAPAKRATRPGPAADRDRPKAFQLLARILFCAVPGMRVGRAGEVTVRISECARDVDRPPEKVRQALLFLERQGYLRVVQRLPGYWGLVLTRPDAFDPRHDQGLTDEVAE